jgi:hypothetical protein
MSINLYVLILAVLLIGGPALYVAACGYGLGAGMLAAVLVLPITYPIGVAVVGGIMAFFGER